jgi:hypothetical protein
MLPEAAGVAAGAGAGVDVGAGVGVGGAGAADEVAAPAIVSAAAARDAAATEVMLIVLIWMTPFCTGLLGATPLGTTLNVARSVARGHAGPRSSPVVHYWTGRNSLLAWAA